MSKITASCNIGLWYQGILMDLVERDDFRFAEDLVVTWEYTEGVPMLGVFLPKFISGKKKAT